MIASSGPDLDAMIAALLTESSLTLPDLARLTDRQIFHLYYHPRDKEGKVVPKTITISQAPSRDEVTSVRQAAEIHFSIGANLGISREELELAWLAKHPTIPEGV